MLEKVRFGGKEVDGVYRFELTGGALALDFANTLNDRESAPSETLTTYKRLLEWSEQSGALPKHVCADLLIGARKAPRKASRALAQARRLRESVFSLFAGARGGAGITAPLLDDFNHWIDRANARTRLAYADGEFAWRCDPQPEDPAAMLWPVVRSAVSILTDKPTLSRVRLCEGEGCAWLFLDTSRPGNKRWCDMTVCGNRAKARRYRQRRRAARLP